jgi:OPT family oligopeptide transporter
MLGIGIIVGLPIALSVLLGSALAWGVIAPQLANAQVVDASKGYEAFTGWLTWPGVGLMVGSAVIALAAQARSLLGAVRDMRALGGVGDGPSRWLIGMGLVACGLVLALGYWVFGLSLLHTLLMLALVLPLCAVCGRGAGQTDVAPAGQMGQIAQATSGALFAGSPGLNVAASSVVAGAAAQTGVSLWSLKAGHLLGASPARQLRAQLVGVLVGAVVSVSAYLLLVKAYGLGSEALPVPTAHQFRAVAELATQGLSGLPPYAAQATAIGFVVGAALTLAARGRLERFVPSPVAMGLGFIMPAYFAVTITVGALLAALARRARPQDLGQHLPSLGAGTIVGESLMGLAIAALRALGVI